MVRVCLSALLLSFGTSAFACGVPSDPCELDEGAYLLRLPDVDAKGALLFLHGWGGSAQGTMNNARLVASVLERGYAFVAPNGMPRAQGGGGAWSFRSDVTNARDDMAFLADVMEDLSARHGLPEDQMLLGGFSAGGFMVSYTACERPDTAAAYVPVSGGFWRPHPEECEGPVRLFHTHGWDDTVVPLEGRILGGGRFRQGDIFHGLDLFRQVSECDAMRPDRAFTDGTFWRRSWTACADGGALELALFPGGHTVPAGWADMVFDWYEALP